MLEEILRLAESAAQLLYADPGAAADRLDQIGSLVHEYAARIRANTGGRAPASPGGLGDRCRMRVAGPDGVVKQETATGG